MMVKITQTFDSLQYPCSTGEWHCTGVNRGIRPSLRICVTPPLDPGKEPDVLFSAPDGRHTTAALDPCAMPRRFQGRCLQRLFFFQSAWVRVECVIVMLAAHGKYILLRANGMLQRLQVIGTFAAGSLAR